MAILPVPELRRGKLAAADAAVEKMGGSRKGAAVGICVARPLEPAALGLCTKPCLLRKGSKFIFCICL